MLSGAMFDEASRRQKIMQFSLDRLQRRLDLVRPSHLHALLAVVSVWLCICMLGSRLPYLQAVLAVGSVQECVCMLG